MRCIYSLRTLTILLLACPLVARQSYTGQANSFVDQTENKAEAESSHFPMFTDVAEAAGIKFKHRSDLPPIFSPAII